MKRRKFSREFKIEAVKLVRERGVSGAQAGRDTDMPVRTFGTFTQDLHHLADWFKACGVTRVAMESTGVYWIPAYEILEQRGFEVILVNARWDARCHSSMETIRAALVGNNRHEHVSP